MRQRVLGRRQVSGPDHRTGDHLWRASGSLMAGGDPLDSPAAP
ncbi:hypothetical protein [Nonomuraea sp. SYSU D8015]|nr:hypothetical protein [Nonomuraea sp. SYSU D8015]